jgi:hypothetical protein
MIYYASCETLPYRHAESEVKVRTPPAAGMHKSGAGW